jgi:transcriptional regulator with XRE-family HTH domain
MQEILSKKSLGERIKSLRIEKGYAQADVAHFLKLSRSNYSQIELGNHFPTFNTLNIIARRYNKSYEWLLHGNETANEQEKTKSFISVMHELENSLQDFSVTLKELEKELQHLKKNIAVS